MAGLSVTYTGLPAWELQTFTKPFRNAQRRGASRENSLQLCVHRERMASPIVLRRSARLSARAAPTTTAVVHSPSQSPSQSPSPSPSPSPPSSPEREIIVKKRRKEGKKGTTTLAKQLVISPKRKKISAYFSKTVTVDEKKTTAVRAKKAAAEKICNAGANDSETRHESVGVHEVSPITTGSSVKETPVADKHERLLKKGPSRDMEAELWEMGFQHVAGVDEAGRGPLAGPVVAAACVIPSHITIDGINDSKKLTEERREELYAILTTTPGISYAVHIIDAPKIDEVNILQATMLAMAACVKTLDCGEDGLPCPDFVLIDGNRLPSGLPETKVRSVVKGDALCHVIAAASILAKVTRDRLMIDYDKRWPMYGFKAHKGYGTAAHIAAIRKHGPCDIHRMTFAPLKAKTVSTGDAKEGALTSSKSNSKKGQQTKTAS